MTKYITKCYGYPFADTKAREDIKEINDYLNKMDINIDTDTIYTNLICVDSISDLKIVNLKPNNYVMTLGYYKPNDGGHGTYRIIEGTYTDDGGSYHRLANGLYAELIVGTKINIKQFGAKCDGITDDTNAIQKCINFSVGKYKIDGCMKSACISKTIMIPTYSYIEHLYLKTMIGGNYIKSFMVIINSTDGETWYDTYNIPQTVTLYDIDLTNTNEQNHGIITSYHVNGILSFASLTLENIVTRGLNISYREAPQYLDSVQIKRINCINKTGSDYAIDLGYLGDSCLLDTAMIDRVLNDGQYKFITVGGAHFPITIKNIIGGEIYLIDSQCTIENIHSEEAGIIIEGSNAVVKNAYLWAHNGGKIILNNAKCVIDNCLFRYDLKDPEKTLEDVSDIDVELNNNSTLKVINSYKEVLIRDMVGKEDTRTAIKTNIENINCALSKSIYSNNSNCNDVELLSEKATISDKFRNITKLVEDCKWYEETGTYVYCMKQILDETRRIGCGTEQYFTINLVNGEYGMCIDTDPYIKAEIYRGNSKERLTEKVIVPIIDKGIKDNGFMISGYKWKKYSETGTIPEGFNEATYIKNNPNGTIETALESIPIYGIWKKGDIIFNTNPVNFVGWICIEGGSPGIWKKFGLIEN